jgi:hypothetical protein
VRYEPEPVTLQGTVSISVGKHPDGTRQERPILQLENAVTVEPSAQAYDEGAPPGESYAMKNVIGEHYRELAASSAFYRAESFEEVVDGIGRALAHPHELADERRRVARRVVGHVDGHAGERVIDAIVKTVGS